MRRARAPERGFTLLEVLIAVLLVSIGVFGFAKMQALAVSGTQVASSRSVVALQGSSLAAAMHSDRAFWAGGVAPATFSLTGSGPTVTDASGVLNATVSTCNATVKPGTPLCTPAQLAAFDLQSWGRNLYNLVPTYTANGACSTTAGAPISCTITITWSEKYVSAYRNAASAALASAATGGQRSYSVYVEP